MGMWETHKNTLLFVKIDFWELSKGLTFAESPSCSPRQFYVFVEHTAELQEIKLSRVKLTWISILRRS